MVLKVIIHHRYIAAAGKSEPRENRIVLSKVFSKIHPYEVVSSCAKRFDDLPRAIRRTVVNQQQLVAVASLGERLLDGCCESFETICAFEDRNDDRHPWPRLIVFAGIGHWLHHNDAG